MPADYINVVYLDVYFLPQNPQLGWICGYEGKTLRTTDGGKSWQGSRIFNNLGFTVEAQLESIYFVNENIGFTSGPTSSFEGGGVIYKTTDGGANWFNITPPNVTDLWGTYFLDENNGVVLGGGCGSPQYFWRTFNGGTTWQSIIYNQPGSKMSDAIIYSNDGLGYAVGSGWLWKTTNGGRTWLPIRSTGNVDWHEEITNIEQTFLIPYSEGCFGNTVTSVGGIRISHDEGRNWSQYNTGVPMFGTFLHDKERGWAAGFNRTVIYTGDGGKTWKSENCGIENGANLDDIWFLNDTTGWVVGNGVYEYFIPDAKPPIILDISGNDFKICEGDTVTLTASEGYDAYIWSNGENGRIIKVTIPGIYSVRGIIDSICYDGVSGSIEVKFYDKYEPEIEISSSGPPCQGDTIEIFAKNKFNIIEWQDGSLSDTFQVTESGNYSLKFIDTNGCSGEFSIQIDFVPNPKPKIIPSGRMNFCVGDSVELNPDIDYAKYEWYITDSEQVYSSSKSIIVKNSGNYYLKVTNSNGCSGISDTVSVTVRDEKDAIVFIFDSISNSYDLDSAFYKQVLCRNIILKNISDKDVIINDLYFFRNISFSSPQTQFPIIVLRNSEISIKVCFSPEKVGINKDTVLYSDICSDHIIPLFGYGITESTIDLSKCDVPLEFEISGFSNKIIQAGFSEFYPNPSSSNSSIDFTIINNDFKTDDINIQIIDAYGNLINVDYIILSQNTDSEINNGKITVNTKNLNSGIYIMTIKLYGKLFNKKFLLAK